MYTLQRRKVKDKLDTLGKQLQSEFQAAGLELVMHLSDDHPSLWNKKKVDTQWLFFSRDVNAQKELSEVIDTEKTLAATLEDPTPLYRHIFLGVSVNETALEVGIRLHHDAWVDRKNLLAILTDAGKQSQFIELCADLPQTIGFGLHQNELTAMGDVTSGTLDQFQQEFDAADKGWMFFGIKINKDDAIALGEGIQQTVADSMNALVKAYRFIAWSPQNDVLSMDNILEQKKQERQATHEELLQAQKEREEKQRQIVAERQAQNEAKKQEMLDEQAWREQERAKRRAVARARREQEATQAAAGFHTATGTNSAASVSTTPESPASAETNGNQAGPDANEAKEATSRERNSRAPKDRADRGRRDNRDSRDSRNAGDSRRRERASMQRNRPDGKGAPKGKGRKNSFQSAPSKPNKPIKVSDERKADIQVGDRIVVVSGFLKGRDGIVQNIDEKGDLKVSFGMLSSRVPKGDVQGQGPAV